MNKIAIFIDGANFYASTKSLEVEIDYKKLLAYFGEKGKVLRAYYYTSVHKEGEHQTIRPLLDYLDYNGYTVVTKPVKEFLEAHRTKLKGNMDVELTVDAMNIASHVDTIYLFSGDGDFKALVKAIQDKGVYVAVVSTREGKTPMIADELRRQADEFIEMKDILSDIRKERKEKVAGEETADNSQLPDFVTKP